jgi:multiple sugar transport system substrate-binding protein
MKSAKTRVSSLLALMATTVLLGSTAACNSGSGGQEGETTITYAYWDAERTEVTEQIIADFNKIHPEITVTPQLTPYEAYFTKLQTTSASRTAPDVFWLGTPQFKFFVDGGAVADLTDKIKSEIDVEDFYPAPIADTSWNGRQYCLPADLSSYALLYNKEMFDAEGIDYPDESWTWENVIDAAQKLTDSESGVYGLDAPKPTSNWAFYNQILQAGGRVLSEDGKRSEFDSPETIKGVQFWTDMILKYKASPDAQALAKANGLARFISGKTAMYYGASWDPSTVAKSPKAVKRTGIAVLPSGVNRDIVSPNVANCVSATTKNAEAAWEFEKFVSSAESNQKVGRSGAALPARKSAAPAFLESVPNLDLKAFTDQLSEGKPYPTTLQASKWEAHMYAGLQRALSGEQSVEEACRQIAREMDEEISQEKSRQ